MQRRQRLRIQRQRRQQEMLRERLRLEQLNSTRYALLTGINYIGTPYTLNGCINDIDNMRDFLQTRRFQSVIADTAASCVTEMATNEMGATSAFIRAC